MLWTLLSPGLGNHGLKLFARPREVDTRLRVALRNRTGGLALEQVSAELAVCGGLVCPHQQRLSNRPGFKVRFVPGSF